MSVIPMSNHTDALFSIAELDREEKERMVK
jgi:hypothetical protein